METNEDYTMWLKKMIKKKYYCGRKKTEMRQFSYKNPFNETFLTSDQKEETNLC